MMVHGLGGHSGHLASVAEYFTRELGMRVYALDNIGHGRSPGRRGHIDSWTQFRRVLTHFVRFVRETENESDRELVLFGNSLGGAICIEFVQRFCEDERMRALIVNAPGLSMQASVCVCVCVGVCM
jgi:acylglycerol lipase